MEFKEVREAKVHLTRSQTLLGSATEQFFMSRMSLGLTGVIGRPSQYNKDLKSEVKLCSFLVLTVVVPLLMALNPLDHGFCEVLESKTSASDLCHFTAKYQGPVGYF